MAGTHQSPRQRRRAVHVRVLIVSKPLQIRVLNLVGPDMKFRARQVTTSAIATDAAHALCPHAEAMEASMAALVRAAAMGGDMTAPRGTLRITASEIMGASVLPGILAGIRFAYPEIVLELALNNRSDDLLRRTPTSPCA